MQTLGKALGRGMMGTCCEGKMPKRALRTCILRRNIAVSVDSSPLSFNFWCCFELY